MKNCKKNISVVMVIVALIVLITGCDNNKNDPKDQSTTLTNLFGEGFTATVKGFLTDTEWAGVSTKIETVLNEAFKVGNPGIKSQFVTVFGRNDGVTIIVGERPIGSSYETTIDGVTLYLNINVLDNDLQSKLTAAVGEMRYNNPIIVKNILLYDQYKVYRLIII